MLTPILMSIAMLNIAPVAQTDPPIACTPKALDATQRKRQTELLGIVRGKIQKTLELDNGFAVQLPNDPSTALQVAEWISLERRCCGFAEFSLEWRLDDTVWVKLTGRSGVKEVLASEMGIGPKR
ncbi:MAG: hypothetical protein K1Y01_05175 [Vicinamibacteria bacterium]|nr:hypothetical protein [Vicinamibacteria bacterium]